MIKHWKFTKHFAERVLVRVGPDFDNTIAAIKREFDDTVLQKVFDCKVRGGFAAVQDWKLRRVLRMGRIKEKDHGDDVV